MAKALLCSINDGNNNFKYNMGKIYSSNPAKNVSLRIKKETGNEFKGKNILGLQTQYRIAKGVVIGYFVNESISKTDMSHLGYYCVQKGVGKNKKYLVMHKESLMNKINTFIDETTRKKKCNVTIINVNNHGFVGVRTKRVINAGEMLYTCYNNEVHYDKIKWQVCQSKVQHPIGQKRKATPNTEDEDNDYTCWHCNRRAELVMCDLCPRSICMSCLDPRETRLMNKSSFFCKECLDNPPAHPNRFVKKKQKIIVMTPSEKINKWLKKRGEKYCSSMELPDGWKTCKIDVLKLFKQIKEKKRFEKTEFVNFAGHRTNKEHPWDIEIVEALIQAISRENSHVYGINLGEIYFTEEALIYLHEQLPRTYVGWIYIAEELNFKNKPSLVGLFRRHKSIDKRKYPNGSNLVANRKERPAWYKNGSIAPWYDGIDNKTLLEKDETMAKTFWGSHNSRYYVTKFGTKFGQVMGV